LAAGGHGPGTASNGSWGAGGGGGWFGGGGAVTADGGGGSGHLHPTRITEGNLISGNQTMPMHTEAGTTVGNTGNGFARITFISSEVNVRTI